MNKKRFLAFTSLLLALLIFAAVSASDNDGQDDKKPPKHNPDTRIVGGTIADTNEYPWQVALVNSGSTNPRAGQFCGGSLIAPGWVLSAAHCFFYRDGTQVPASEIDVVLGVNQLSSGPTAGGQGQRRSLAQIIVHPSYNDITSDNDIALLRLATPATLSCSVNVIDPATAADAARFAPGAIAIITGWGDITQGANAGSDDLREVAVPIVSNATCNASSSYNGQVTNNMICAGQAIGGRDSCQGDSGGPLVVSNGIGGFIQAGVVSWGNGCAAPNFYGVYSRVENYEAWIESNINGNRSGAGVPLAPSISLSQIATELFMPYAANETHSGHTCVAGSVDLPDPNPPTPTPLPGEGGPDSNDISDAIPIIPDQLVTGVVRNPGDRDDVFAISLASGQTVDITLNGSGGDADLYLYPPGTATVNSNDYVQFSQNSGTAETIEWTITQTGVWYVDVYAYSGAISYELVVRVR